MANPYQCNGAKIKVTADGTFTLALRIPEWAEQVKVFVNGKEYAGVKVGEYYKLTQKWSSDIIEIRYVTPVKMRVKNGKIAFEKGAVTLARDSRFEEIEKPVSITVKDGKNVRTKQVNNDTFRSNIALKIQTKNGVITLCDYAQAGKNYDDARCNISVWQDINKEV